MKLYLGDLSPIQFIFNSHSIRINLHYIAFERVARLNRYFGIADVYFKHTFPLQQGTWCDGKGAGHVFSNRYSSTKLLLLRFASDNTPLMLSIFAQAIVPHALMKLTTKGYLLLT